jgi:hypothetical protein
MRDARRGNEQRVVARERGPEREVDVLVVHEEALLVAAEQVKHLAPEDRCRARGREHAVGLGRQLLERALAQELVGVAGRRVLVTGALYQAGGRADEHAPQRPGACVARRGGELREPVRRRRGVGVQHADPGRRGGPHAAVRATREAVVAAQLERLHGGVVRAQERERAVARAVVGHDDLLRRERLRRQGGEAVGQQPLTVVVDDDDRHA